MIVIFKRLEIVQARGVGKPINFNNNDDDVDYNNIDSFSIINCYPSGCIKLWLTTTFSLFWKKINNNGDIDYNNIDTFPFISCYPSGRIRLWLTTTSSLILEVIIMIIVMLIIIILILFPL